MIDLGTEYDYTTTQRKQEIFYYCGDDEKALFLPSPNNSSGRHALLSTALRGFHAFFAAQRSDIKVQESEDGKPKCAQVEKRSFLFR